MWWKDTKGELQLQHWDTRYGLVVWDWHQVMLSKQDQMSIQDINHTLTWLDNAHRMDGMAFSECVRACVCVCQQKQPSFLHFPTAMTNKLQTEANAFKSTYVSQ